AHFLDVLVADDDVAALLELVAFDNVGVRDFALAVRAPALLLNARLALGMELVEADRRARFGRGEHLDRDIDQADLQVTLPGRSRSHMRPIKTCHENTKTVLREHEHCHESTKTRKHEHCHESTKGSWEIRRRWPTSLKPQVSSLIRNP